MFFSLRSLTCRAMYVAVFFLFFMCPGSMAWFVGCAFHGDDLICLCVQTLSRNYLFLGDFTDMSVLAPPQLLVTSVVDAGTNTFNVSVSAENVAPLVWLETKCVRCVGDFFFLFPGLACW